MNTDYEQMELDTRPKLVAALQELTDGTIREAQDMILESRRQIAAENGKDWRDQADDIAEVLEYAEEPAAWT